MIGDCVKMRSTWISIAVLLLFAFPFGGGQLVIRPDHFVTWGGDHAVFTCLISGFPSDVPCPAVYWLRDEYQLVTVQESVFTNQGECSSRLEFNVTASLNQTSLQCLIQIGSNVNRSTSALVTVLQDPILHPVNTTAMEGDHAVFTCLISGFPSDVLCPNMHWHSDGQPVRNGGSLPQDLTVQPSVFPTNQPFQGKCSSRLEFNVTASLNQTTLQCSIQNGSNVRQSTSALLIVLSNVIPTPGGSTSHVTHTILPTPTPTSSVSEDTPTPTLSVSGDTSTPTSSVSGDTSTPTSSASGDTSTKAPMTTSITDEGMRPASTCAVVALIAIAVTTLLSLP